MSLNEIISRFSQYFEKYLPLLSDDNSRTKTVSGLSGSSKSFFVDFLRKNNERIVIITSDDDYGRFLESDLLQLNVSDVDFFPSISTKPYDEKAVIDPTVLVHRAELALQIKNKSRYLLICSVRSLLDKIPSSEHFNGSSITIKKDDELIIDDLRETLTELGYVSVSLVTAPGEFAIRGGIADIFSFSGLYPYRIEFFGDQVDSIREFDPDSQRSISFQNEVRVVPDVTRLNTESLSSLFDHIHQDALLVIHDEPTVLATTDELYRSIEQAFKESDVDSLPPPEKLYLSPTEIKTCLKNYRTIRLSSASGEKNDVPDMGFRPQPIFNGSIKLLRDQIAENTKGQLQTWILCDNDGQRDRFDELLGESGPTLDHVLKISTLHEGFVHTKSGIAVYTDHQIFNRYHRPSTKRKAIRGGISLREIRNLNVGDYVVHVDYGIGQFQGFKQIVVKNTPQEAVVVRYAQDSILYVNVSSLHKLQKYSGKDGAVPQITRLGSGEWARKKARTKSRIKDIARDLIKLYAKRKASTAFAFSPDTGMQMELEASFEFEETPDQFKAIEEVKKDMESVRPMDRLVCGDVGFGKTEVAVRAAFKAVSDGKQVAVLVPTTILADQHAKTFKKRMSNLPVSIEMISRFRTTSEIKDILKRTKEGKIDILIGTHRITSKDVIFKDLGLLVVDEEQRFGVSTKEKIKELRAAVDVLTLTATPIPRTLQYSLMGARDLSVIQTAPPNRQPVYTEIHSFDTALIRDAILQETSRNGQVFFINNRVNNIEEVSSMIRKIVPDVRVRFAHGQMKGAELEKIIVDFYAHKFDVLVSTNIVENGIDIPNANTILINRADMFGLSELHQLRGRVGRSNRKAFCYLLTPPLSDLTVESRKRLLALVEYSDLGSGFNIAMRDLDIRGAGDLLGGEQSGFINDIGIELYTKILNEAISELKQTEFGDVFESEPVTLELPETTVEFDSVALLDKYYVPDDILRLNLYRQLSQASSIDEIQAWENEITDRFGKLTKHAKNLVDAAKIRLHASGLYLSRVVIRADRIWLECPAPGTKQGDHFYDAQIFQQLLKRIESTGSTDFKVTNKDNVVRIVIGNIPDLAFAVKKLESLILNNESILV